VQVYQFWMDDMYLHVKLPLPVNSNPGMVFPRQFFEDQNTQLRYNASRKVYSNIIHFGNLYSTPSRNLLRGVLSPAMAKEK